jgi:hypothetical protein
MLISSSNQTLAACESFSKFDAMSSPPTFGIAHSVSRDNKVNRMWWNESTQTRWSITIALEWTGSLNALEEHTFDLILMDIQMPK